MKLLSAQVWCSCSSLLVALLVLVSGCATTSEPQFSSDAALEGQGQSGGGTNPPGVRIRGEGYRFEVGDMVIVTFSEIPEPPPPHEERIKDDGTITLPYIGPVVAKGKLVGELQSEIHALYVPKYYRRLTVTVKTTTELVYSVLGEVRAPGPKPYAGLTTVTKGIGAAGGLTDYASRKKITLTRANGSKIKVNYNDAIADPKKDPQVFPQDTINVEKKFW